MSHLPFHPAPGLGDMAPGFFALPQNPLTGIDSTVLVPTMGATAPGRWVRTPTMGDLVRGSFVVPQNPVAFQLTQGLGRLRGLGCGCGGGCSMGGCGGMGGLGQTPGTDAISQWLNTNGGSFGTTLADTQTFAGFTLPLWGWLAGGGLVVYALMDLGGKAHKGSKRLAARYASNPRRRRRNESISEGFWSNGIFHPIRAADDYDPEAVGEKRAYAKRRRRKK
jgi:hypothetical protein